MLSTLQRIEQWQGFIKIKENISLLVIIPTIIGGGWQILELSSISIQYLRFFSISQLVSDGVLVLFLILLTIIPYQIGSFVGRKSGSALISRQIGEKIYQYKKRVIYETLFTLIFPLFYAFLKFSNNDYTFMFRDFIIVTFLFAYLSPSFLVLLKKGGILIYIRKKLFIKYTIIEIYNRINPKRVFMLPVLFFFFYIISFGLKEFSENYRYPKNMINLLAINSNLKDKLGVKCEAMSVRYFNDKYVFIEVCNRKSILVIEVSEIFPHGILFSDN